MIEHKPFDDIVYAVFQSLKQLEPEKCWRIAPRKSADPWLEITNDDRETLSINRLYNDKGKLNITVEWPRSRDSKFNLEPIRPWPGIGVSENKDPKTIAADIKRRLLPDYRIKLMEILRIEKIHNEIYDARDQLAKEIMSFLPQYNTDRGKDLRSTIIISAGKYNSSPELPYCTIKVKPDCPNDDGRCNVVFEIETVNEELIYSLANAIGRHFRIHLQPETHEEESHETSI